MKADNLLFRAGTDELHRCRLLPRRQRVIKRRELRRVDLRRHRSLEIRINLLHSIFPDRNHCFGKEKKWINQFKMVYFLLGRYRTNQLISLSEFPVIFVEDQFQQYSRGQGKCCWQIRNSTPPTFCLKQTSKFALNVSSNLPNLCAVCKRYLSQKA